MIWNNQAVTSCSGTTSNKIKECVWDACFDSEEEDDDVTTVDSTVDDDDDDDDDDLTSDVADLVATLMTHPAMRAVCASKDRSILSNPDLVGSLTATNKIQIETLFVVYAQQDGKDTSTGSTP